MSDDPERRPPASSIPAITLAQPDAWCISKSLRPLVNTKWAPPTDMAGKMIAIHTIPRPDRDLMKRLEKRAAALRDQYNIESPPVHRLPYGSIVAVARCVGVFVEEPEEHELARWYRGPYGWVFEEAVPVLPPIPCRGAKEVWRVPERLMPSLRTHYANGKQHLRREAERRRQITEEQEERLALMDPETH